MPDAAQFSLVLSTAPVLERVCGRLLISLLATHTPETLDLIKEIERLERLVAIPASPQALAG